MDNDLKIKWPGKKILMFQKKIKIFNNLKEFKKK